MAHEIGRVLRAFAASPLFIEPVKAAEIVGLLEWRASHGPRDARVFEESQRPPLAARFDAVAPGARGRGGHVNVVNLMGAITPRAGMMDDMSGAVSLEQFGAAFGEAAADPDAAAVLINIDSPGGQVDLVPETVAAIRAARRPGRPIVALANTLAASAAYWIASAADELLVTTSGQVGSIGVYLLHEDMSAALEAEGIRPTFIHEGPRKVEGNPFGPLDEAARMALQARVRSLYEMFTADVAAGRGVAVDVVRADPEDGGTHFGGGRTYLAAEAVRLGMADGIATFGEVVNRLAAGQRATGGARRPRAEDMRRRLQL